MHRNSLLLCEIADSDDLLLRKDHALKGVLEADEACRTEVDVGLEDEVRKDVVKGDVPAIRSDHGHGRSLRMESNTAGLVAMHMGTRVADDRVRRLMEVSPDRQLCGV